MENVDVARDRVVMVVNAAVVEGAKGGEVYWLSMLVVEEAEAGGARAGGGGGKVDCG